MKTSFKIFSIALYGLLLVSCFPLINLYAQDASAVKEPPIPVYMIYPIAEDSLKALNEGTLQGIGTAYVNVLKKYDSLQQQTQKSSAENTAHFIWLFSLVALLGLMNVVMLFSTSRIRKELTQMKHLEHRQMLLTTESSALVQESPMALEPSIQREQLKTPSPVRSRKPRTVKPRFKNQK